MKMTYMRRESLLDFQNAQKEPILDLKRQILDLKLLRKYIPKESVEKNNVEIRELSEELKVLYFSVYEDSSIPELFKA
jgi:hypothetical protein